MKMKINNDREQRRAIRAKRGVKIWGDGSTADEAAMCFRTGDNLRWREFMKKTNNGFLHEGFVLGRDSAWLKSL